jgi:uncharacterized protein YndB with AHSA1/START domain
MNNPTKHPEKAKVTTPSDRTILIERIFNAPRHRVWAAFTVPSLVAQWWGRGNKLEGRYREVSPESRLSYTFEWDGMPGHVIVETVELEELPDRRTRVVNTSLFHTTEDRDGMMSSGMEQGLNQSYEALDRLLANHP